MTVPVPLFVPLALTGLFACSPSAPTEAVEQEPTTKVALVDVVAASAPRVVDATGTIIADVDARIAAGATGRVEAVLAQRGASVKEGDVLLQLDDRVLVGARDEARAALRQAEANATLAADDCQRAEAIFAKGLSDEATIGRARAQCAATAAAADAAKARLAQAQARVDYTRLKAPFSGIISERMVDPGEYVRDDSVAFTLVASEPLRLQLTLSPEAATEIHGSEPVAFTVAGSAEPHTASVDRIAPGLREKGRDLLIEALVSDIDASKLKPGLFVSAHVQIGDQEVPAVPAAAIRTAGELHTVFIAIEGRLEARIVELGEPVGELVTVTAGVKVGEKVAATNDESVRDGARLE
jgi:membrane fusion protein (multidrug efflux system)